MQEKFIVLKQIDDVKSFVNLTMGKNFEIDLVSGKYIVNAKSIMGIFSLDLSKPICMRADCAENDAFMEEIKQFLPEE